MYLEIPCHLSTIIKIPAVASLGFARFARSFTTWNDQLTTHKKRQFATKRHHPATFVTNFLKSCSLSLSPFALLMKFNLFCMVSNESHFSSFCVTQNAHIHSWETHAFTILCLAVKIIPFSLNESSVQRNIGHSLNSLFNSDFNSIGLENPATAQL